jgi:hypothetical protein
MWAPDILPQVAHSPCPTFVPWAVHVRRFFICAECWCHFDSGAGFQFVGPATGGEARMTPGHLAQVSASLYSASLYSSAPILLVSTCWERASSAPRWSFVHGERLPSELCRSDIPADHLRRASHPLHCVAVTQDRLLRYKLRGSVPSVKRVPLPASTRGCFWADSAAGPDPTRRIWRVLTSRSRCRMASPPVVVAW